MRVAKSIYDEEYRKIIDALKAARKSACLTQQDVADRLRRPQSYIAKVEGCERRLDVVEFLHFCRAIGAEPIHFLTDTTSVLPSAARHGD